MTALDVSNNPKLEDLSCDYNSLTLLDLSKNLELEILSCRKNGLTSLDLDANKKIGEKILYLENQFYHKGVLNAERPLT